MLAQNTTTNTQKIRSLELEVTTLRETTTMLEANPPINHAALNEELRKQKEYYTELLDGNANRFVAE